MSFIFHIVENRRYYFILSGILISLGILAMIISTLPPARRFVSA